MSAVNPVEAIKYGFELIVYLAAVVIGGGIVAAIGFGMIGAASGMLQESLAVGGILMLFGVVIGLLGYLIMIAGQLGIGYKVIADGVQKGVSERN